jgi:2-dehydropantoate 2-reductase
MLGAGGVGGYYGGRLALAGHDVVFVARGAHGEALARSGLRVRSKLGDFGVHPVNVLTDVSTGKTVDVVIVAVKLWDTELAVRSAAPLCSEKTVVLSLQNGIEKDEIIAGIVGHSRVIGGVTYILADLAAPGLIVHTGHFQTIIAGELGGGDSARVRDIVAVFADAGIDASASTDIRSETWKKFIFLSSVSGITSATRRTIGDLRADATTRALLHDALQEATSLAGAEGVTIPERFVEERLAFIDTLPPDGRSSMAQDLLRGGRLELEWLSGAVVRRAARLGLEVPTHERFYTQLLPYVSGGRATP